MAAPLPSRLSYPQSKRKHKNTPKALDYSTSIDGSRSAATPLRQWNNQRSGLSMPEQRFARSGLLSHIRFGLIMKKKVAMSSYSSFQNHAVVL
jgi:hypothetical protein